MKMKYHTPSVPISRITAFNIKLGQMAPHFTNGFSLLLGKGRTNLYTPIKFKVHSVT